MFYHFFERIHFSFFFFRCYNENKNFLFGYCMQFLSVMVFLISFKIYSPVSSIEFLCKYLSKKFINFILYIFLNFCFKYSTLLKKK